MGGAGLREEFQLSGKRVLVARTKRGYHQRREASGTNCRKTKSWGRYRERGAIIDSKKALLHEVGERVDLLNKLHERI